MSNSIHNIINGEIYKSKSNRFGPLFNPATGEQTGSVDLCSADDVNKAINAAKEALPAWVEMPPVKRARMMMRFRELLLENQDELAKVLGSEHGKVFEDALGEIIRGIENVEFACGIPQLLKGEHSRNVGPSIDSFSLRFPLGVCAGITPFNFPAMVPLWMYPNAIACGNTFVLKPSERNPATPLFVYELFKKAGFPDGVLNIVNGDKEAVDCLLTHKDIKAISFVGSTPIAKYVYRTGTSNGKRVQALGGAKNHMIILPDADIDQAADALMGAGYGSAGERCMAISVAVAVGDETADALVERLVPRIKELKVGPYTDPNAQMGPMITKDHFNKVSGYIKTGIEEGAELLVDGRKLSIKGYENGYFLGGSLFDHVNPEMSIYQEEIFGPVLCMVRVDNPLQAFELVQNHQFGNGTALFTRSGEAAREFTDKVEVGMVGINVPIPVPVSYYSFGGWKQSLFGSHSIYGPDGIHFYTRLKTVTTRWPRSIGAGADFYFPNVK